MKEKFFINAKVKKIDGKIKSAIKKAGITYPHHSLAFFKATYAKFEDANLNNVILADSVRDDVKYLIGTQVNQNHLREGYILGSIIDAYVNKNDEIEIVFTFAKTVYNEQYEEALELMASGDLTVSFELMVSKENVEIVSGGAKRLTKVDFDGVGLLFGVKPAYPNAYVLETAMKIIEKAFNQEDKQLVYASAKDITQKWVQIGSLIEKAINDKNIDEENKTEGESIMDKKTQDALLAKQKSFIIEEFGEVVVEDWSDEDFLNQDKIDALRDSLKSELESEDVEESEEEKIEEKDESEEVAEEVIEEPKAEEVAEEEVEEPKAEEPVEEVIEEPKVEEPAEEPKVEEVVEEPKVEEVVEEPKVEEVVEEAKEVVEETAEKMSVVVEEKVKTEQTFDDETMEETVKVESETTVERDGKKTVEEKMTKEVTYTYAEVEALKAEYAEEIDKLKEQTEFYKLNAKTVVEVRAELGRFVEELSDKDLFDETKIEIARLKKENAELREKQPVVASVEKEELTAKLEEVDASEEAKIKYMKKRTRQV